MILLPKVKEQTATAQFIEKEIKAFARASPLNRMPLSDNFIFDEPLVQFADGDDPIFLQYKTIIDSSHLTPREALAKTYNQSPEDIPPQLSVISWILPITSKTRESNRRQITTPSRFWSYTRWYGEKFNDALRKHVVKFLTEIGYLAVAPVVEPYFKRMTNEKGNYSNWSERHIAYAAGLGTFSLSDGFITECGIAHRCGSVVTNLVLPARPRIAKNPYSNCLFYVNRKCRACIARCPAGAITESGHDKLRCKEYMDSEIGYLREEYNVRVTGCGLCQTKVPCEFRNPAKKLSKKTG
ncbi:MAG: epoxyqueuosine reductase [Dehalococcoidales bacterium]